MDEYKKIIKSRKTRKFILNCLRFVPNKTMLKLQYKIKLKRKLDLKHPQRFTEKIQWYKINYKNPVMHKCVDKFLVRDYVKSKNLESILVPLYGKYNSVKDINWEILPQNYIVKTTHGGGGLNVLICTEKNKLKKEDIESTLKDGGKKYKNRSDGREWAYYGLEPGIVVEKLLINELNPKAGINDYKIMCFNGKAKYIIVDADRYIGHKRNFYDLEWNNLNITSDCPKITEKIEKPKNLDKMIEIANKLSEDFPFVRVDLYNLDGKIYFGELTFYPWSGYVQFTPDEFDYKMGEDFELPH